MFKSIFGADNKIIGVTTIVAVFMLMGRDFTGAPLNNTLNFVMVNLLIGIGATLAVKNMWLAIPINFFVVFTLSYIFTYNLRQPLYFPFCMQYIYILSTSIPFNQLGTRLLALVAGALLIMVVQMVVNNIGGFRTVASIIKNKQKLLKM